MRLVSSLIWLVSPLIRLVSSLIWLVSLLIWLVSPLIWLVSPLIWLASLLIWLVSPLIWPVSSLMWLVSSLSSFSAFLFSMSFKYHWFNSSTCLLSSKVRGSVKNLSTADFHSLPFESPCAILTMASLMLAHKDRNLSSCISMFSLSWQILFRYHLIRAKSADNVRSELSGSSCQLPVGVGRLQIVLSNLKSMVISKSTDDPHFPADG